MFSRLTLILFICSAGAGLTFVPPELTEPLRGLVRDAAHPGQFTTTAFMGLVRHVSERVHDWQTAEEQLEQLRTALAKNERAMRQLQEDQARLREELEQARAKAGPRLVPSSSEPLLVPHLIEARLIGSETASLWRNRKLLDAGSADGVETSLLVLGRDDQLILDVGTDAAISERQPVYAGDVVVGRIAAAGRWTSTLESVTDANFRGAARVLRKTDAGWWRGPTGLLKGDGSELCLLDGIEASQPVEVGDAVVTATEDGVLPVPMFYGKIVEARLRPGGTRWEIRVEPAMKNQRLETVHVLRTNLNPTRLLAN